jgi:CBS domain-containing protein
LFQLIRKRRLHRLVVVAGDNDPEGKKKGTLVGIISLSDVMRYVITDADQGRGGKLDVVGEGHTPDEGTTPPGGGGGGGTGSGAGTPGGELIEVSTTPTAPPPLPLPLVP